MRGTANINPIRLKRVSLIHLCTAPQAIYRSTTNHVSYESCKFWESAKVFCGGGLVVIQVCFVVLVYYSVVFPKNPNM